MSTISAAMQPTSITRRPLPRGLCPAGGGLRPILSRGTRSSSSFSILPRGLSSRPAVGTKASASAQQPAGASPAAPVPNPMAGKIYEAATGFLETLVIVGAAITRFLSAPFRRGAEGQGSAGTPRYDGIGLLVQALGALGRLANSDEWREVPARDPLRALISRHAATRAASATTSSSPAPKYMPGSVSLPGHASGSRSGSSSTQRQLQPLSAAAGWSVLSAIAGFFAGLLASAGSVLSASLKAPPAIKAPTLPIPAIATPTITAPPSAGPAVMAKAAQDKASMDQKLSEIAKPANPSALVPPPPSSRAKLPEQAVFSKMVKPANPAALEPPAPSSPIKPALQGDALFAALTRPKSPAALEPPPVKISPAAAQQALPQDVVFAQLAMPAPARSVPAPAAPVATSATPAPVAAAAAVPVAKAEAAAAPAPAAASAPAARSAATAAPAPAKTGAGAGLVAWASHTITQALGGGGKRAAGAAAAAASASASSQESSLQEPIIQVVDQQQLAASVHAFKELAAEAHQPLRSAHAPTFLLLHAAFTAAQDMRVATWQSIYLPGLADLRAAAKADVPRLVSDMRARSQLQPLADLLTGCSNEEVLVRLAAITHHALSSGSPSSSSGSREQQPSLAA